MRLDLGSDVACRDGKFGKLVEVVIDPAAGRINFSAVPIGAVARVETDAAMRSLTRAEVVPPVAIHRWPRTVEHGISRR